MISKKERIMGMEVSFARSPSQAFRAFFGTVERGKAPIRRFSHEYRTYRKRLVEEGRGSKWHTETSGREREVLGIKRMHDRRNSW